MDPNASQTNTGRVKTDSNLTLRIDKVQKDIETVHELKDTAIQTLEEKKRAVREETDPLGEEAKFYEQQITSVEGQVEEVLTEIEPKMEIVVKEKISVDELGRTIYQMERDISRIQHEHDEAILEMERKKASLKANLEAMEQIEMLINVLNYKIYEAQYEHRMIMDELMKEREALLARTDLTPSQLALALAEIDKKIATAANMHEEALLSMEGQRSELQTESKLKMDLMNMDMETLKDRYQQLLDELEAQKLNATPSELEIINAKIAALKMKFECEMEKLQEIQTKGWQDKTSEERLAALLAARGLQVTKSGRILTGSGRLLTIEEALQMGLLDGLDMSLEHLLKYQKFDDDEETLTSQESSEDSVFSKLSSEDVHYLKEMLGKPLTLALAEITAKQPRDPIHYLGHWLLKYRYNQELDEIKALEVQALTEGRARLAQEKMREFIENTAREAVLEMILRAENEAYRREMERELRRIAEEEAMAEEG